MDPDLHLVQICLSLPNHLPPSHTMATSLCQDFTDSVSSLKVNSDCSIKMALLENGGDESRSEVLATKA